MKRQILTLVMALVAVLTVSAQRMVRVINGEPKDTIEVWRLDQVYFIADSVVTLTDKPDTVDLGLSVRWADRNMGASSPKNKGRLIGWGDITLTNLSKKNEFFPVEDANKDIYGGNYDVATQRWDGKWRMPSQKEMRELLDNCTWTWVNDGDSVGYVVTREGYENKLFLPVTGYREGETDATETSKGYYWTGSINGNANTTAHMLQLNSDTYSLGTLDRFMGLAIRPVTGALVVPLAIGEPVVSDVTEKTATVTVALTGDLSDVTMIIVSYGTSEDELSYSETIDNHHEITTNIGSLVTINLKGLTQGTTYYVKVYVKKADGSNTEGKTVTLTTVKNESFPVADIVDMDMPSGTKWSSWNMGASSPFIAPSDAYYVWGDAEGTVTSTNISDNPYFKNTPVADRGKLVNIAGTQYDIATKKWGEGWQLPTKEQFEELINFSTTKFVKEKINGIEYEALRCVSKRNGATIYLPCAGLLRNNEKINGNVGYFWTAENGDVAAAYIAQPSENVVNIDRYPYTFRLSVRPVYVGKSSNNNNENPQDGTRPLTSAGRAAKAVDLGLGVKWATYNVGTTSDMAAGYYVAFGDTLERQDYTLANYIHYDALTKKYTTEGMNPLDAKYDAANCQWGGTWRMPTFEEWADLINHCDWVWEGKGYRVYKKGSTNKDESIFLPVTGYKVTEYSSISHYFQNQCIYWISQYNTLKGKEGDAYVFLGASDGISTASYARYFGVCVRPVKP